MSQKVIQGTQKSAEAIRNRRQELAIYLFSEEAEFLMDCMSPEMEACGIEGLDMWKEWAFDLFDDMDIVTYLYSDNYLTHDHIYHFDHWTEDLYSV